MFPPHTHTHNFPPVSTAIQLLCRLHSFIKLKCIKWIKHSYSKSLWHCSMRNCGLVVNMQFYNLGGSSWIILKTTQTLVWIDILSVHPGALRALKLDVNWNLYDVCKSHNALKPHKSWTGRCRECRGHSRGPRAQLFANTGIAVMNSAGSEKQAPNSL